MNLASRLADYYSRQRYDSLPTEVAARGAEHNAYMLMLALKGHRNAEEAGQALALAKRLSDRGGDATVVGTDLRVQAIDAAFANTTLMRALEIDDVMFPVGVHTGLVTTPPAPALAERHHRTGAELIAAVVSGYSIGKLDEVPGGFWHSFRPLHGDPRASLGGAPGRGRARSRGR